MCSANEPASDIPDWLRTVLGLAFKHRASVAPALALALAVAGLLIYHLSPTDIDRAEADLAKARARVNALDEEAYSRIQEARQHSTRAEEILKHLEERKDSTDAEWLEWRRAAAHTQSQLAQAKYARRSNLLHLSAEYRRLLAEAECEVLRAKDARDRGTPYEVSPRVRELLAPMISAR
ncbi:MAG: hypothetical protein C0501_29795 [Isosphaera sp.]|nr:hypothetical protein [Isosphaera sp.]